MTWDIVDRRGIAAELDQARLELHYLLDRAGTADFERTSNGTRWTNEQLLFHMVFGFMVVARLLPLVRVLGRLPAPVGRSYAWLLDAADHLRHRRLADLADVYADASPDLWNGLANAVRTAQTFNDHRADIDEALMAAVGFANDAADSFERGGPYLVRGAADLIPTTKLLDDYRGMIFCTIRKFAEAQKRSAAVVGGNGYSLATSSGTIGGGGNPYVYPDNLPRVNAHGGPEGRPGCWQDISRDLWPAPYLVMDTGASIAPYNHIELGQPFLIDYVWGRQIGEYTINP